MRPLALFLALLAPAAASASESLPIQEKTGWYRTVREFREADVVRRRSFPVDYTLDAKAKFLYCMIAPGADWALDSREEAIEEQYLRLLAAAMHLDALTSHDGPSGGVVGFCGTLRSPAARVDLDRIDASWRSVCQVPVEASRPGRYTCTAPSGGAVIPPKLAVIQTLRILAKSPHLKTARKALDLMEEIKGRDKFFAKNVSEILLDAAAPLAVRERAAEVLASVHTHDLSAHTVATVWGDEKGPESLRRAALRGYSLIMGFADQREGKNSPEAVRDRLRRYLPALAAVVQAETKDGKDGKGGKDTLTPLGEEAKCVAQLYSVRWLCYMNRNGAGWYEELKKDEAAGRDACAADGKLGR